MQPTNNSRQSPDLNEGFFSGLKRAVLAYKKSTQLMSPEQAILELEERVEQCTRDFDWMDRVNKLLSILTSKVETVIDEKTDQNILKIEKWAHVKYTRLGYPPVDFASFALMDPRKEGMFEWDFLVQLIGRCHLLHKIHVKSREGGEALTDLQKQLRATHEEELRLGHALNERSKEKAQVQESFSSEIQRLTEEFNQNSAKIRAELVEVDRERKELRSENTLLKNELRAFQDRLKQLNWRIQDLEEEVQKAKELGSHPEVVAREIEPVEEKTPRNKELEVAVRKLEQENNVLIQEREELLLINGELHSRLKKAEEGREFEETRAVTAEKRLEEIDRFTLKVEKSYQEQQPKEIVQALENLYDAIQSTKNYPSQ